MAKKPTVKETVKKPRKPRAVSVEDLEAKHDETLHFTSDNHQYVGKPEQLSNDFILAGAMKLEKTEWLLEDRIMKNAINMIDGRKNAGKSSVMGQVVASYSRGLDALGGKLKGITKPYVLWLQHEEDYAADVVPRLKHFGYDSNFVIVPKTAGAMRKILLPTGAEELAKMIRGAAIGLVVIDPFSGLSDGKSSQNDQDGMRRYMEAIKTACCDNGATVLCSRHLRKGTSGPAAEQGLGSTAIGAVARVTLRLDSHPIKKKLKLLSVVCSSKRKPMALGYELIDREGSFPDLVWRGEQDVSLEEILEGAMAEDIVDEAKDAATVMFGLLKAGPVWSKEILSAGKDAGISERTMRKAKAIHGIKSERRVSEETGDAKLFWMPLEDAQAVTGSVAELQSCEKPVEIGDNSQPCNPATLQGRG